MREVEEKVEMEEFAEQAAENSIEENAVEENVANEEGNSLDGNSHDSKKAKTKTKELKAKIIALESDLKEKGARSAELTDRLQRLSAEYDNYRKRTGREKDALYTDAICDALKEILPVLDNFERAVSVEETDVESLKTGLQMVYKQFYETLEKLGMEKIEAVGTPFDPNLHNAVMHVEDDAYGENEVAEEMQTGYKIKDRVVRHSYVKVAN